MPMTTPPLMPLGYILANALSSQPRRCSKTLVMSILLSGTILLSACANSNVSLAGESPAGDTQGADSQEAEVPTPIDEFAPESMRPNGAQPYDQGLTVSQVEIGGNKLIQADDIRDAMATRPGALYSRAALQQDLRRVYDMGYFTDNIKATPVATSQGIVVRIEVEENAPVTNVNIQGNSIIADDELIGLFKTQTGLPQNVTQINESIKRIEKTYADKGYVLAKVTAISDDPDGSINLNINEGKVDHILLSGNRKTKDEVIRRQLTLEEGKIYNETQLREDMQRLFATQAFSDVRRVITPSAHDPSKFDVTVEVDEKRTSALSLGGGLDSGTGVFGSVGFNDPNFLGRGQDFRSVFSVGSGNLYRNRQTQANARTYQFEVGWSTPNFLGTDNAANTSTYGRSLASFNVPLAIERRFGAEVGWSRALKSHPHTAFNIGLRGEGVKLREGGSDSVLDDFDISQSVRDDMLQGGTYAMLTPTIAYDTRDNRFDPTSGWLNTIGMVGAYGIGNDSYGTVTVNLRKYMKISEKATLALNAQAGQTLLGDMPAFNAYRLGGTQSVRGFQEGGLGIGGGFLLGSAEVRTPFPFIEQISQKAPILKGLKSAFFIDAGQVLNQTSSIKSINNAFDRNTLGVSIGAGVRMTIPGVGPIRLDYAIPIAGGGRYTRRFNFGMGQKF
ncbi:MAG: BamA/TamA family outer membrane protein [Vampirovibrionales bacterium]|nr:BamA/TamA family outer membrane protein [Vampirovibrionales bacterium]